MSRFRAGLRVLDMSMMRAALLLGLASLLGAVELRTAAGHRMQYYVSLPTGWTAGKSWPVVVVIESADKQFEKTAEVFAKASAGMPFVIVTPLVTTNGGVHYRDADTYRYTEAVWAEIEGDRCGFDETGIAAAVKDVGRLYGGESRYFLTGWEAGAHTVWAMLFRHPEVLRAAAPTVANYAGRCLEGGFSRRPERAGLPVKIFHVVNGKDESPGKFFRGQTEEAEKVALAQGFRNVSREEVPGKEHGPLAEEVLGWFWKVYRQK